MRFKNLVDWLEMINSKINQIQQDIDFIKEKISEKENK